MTPPDPPAKVPFAVLVMTDDYPSAIKAISGGIEAEPVPQDGGYDAVPLFGGQETWFATKGPGFVAVGPDRALIAAVARPGGKTLDAALTPTLAGPFLAGDVGAYVNVAALATRYADRIEQGRQGFMAALDQAGQQAGNAASMDAAKAIYGHLFDALKDADALTMDLDFAAEGLRLTGALTVVADTDAARAIASSRTGNAADLGKLPPGAAFYAYLNMDAATFDRLQGFSIRMLYPGGRATAELERASALFRDMGRIESIGSFGLADGMRALNVARVSDPGKYIEATRAMLLAMKGGKGPLNVYKDFTIEADAETYRGLSFTHVVATLDLDKLAELGAKDPATVASMKSMFGGDALSYWLAADGERVIQVTTPTWDDARAQIDAYMKGEAGIGSTPGYRAVRDRLPEEANLLMLVSAQGLARMFAVQFAAALNKPDLQLPGDLPAEPALFGVSLTPRPPIGYEFHLVVPSGVGPVVEKGMVPLFRNLAGQVDR